MNKPRNPLIPEHPCIAIARSVRIELEIEDRKFSERIDNDYEDSYYA